ncbi:hypothetical protein GPECTOR_1g561 [Gonium pectorale]|uniref:Flagellar associated protein n=1 Tax=Gonium pectorale TaxID=33097 RepID=A0A150H3K6_GONPE|nr:hypothetical protein GPECTOR_1g561 [Gonium pectorale]|eukprot:KXZ56623.1 hypothetical protein GPECTOR_1g561 [Gonium pectorale]
MGASRDGREKVFISQTHVEVDRKCREGPGHIYNVPGALNRQPEARKETAASYSFAHTARLKEAPSTTPAPGTYQPVVTSIGDQSVSRHLSPSRVLFGTGTRDQAQKLFLSSRHVQQQRGTLGSPPGSYDVPGAMGHQVASVKPSSPSFSLPRTDRLKDKYEALSKTMPAAGQYETWNSIGKQTLSLSRTMPAYGFGSSSRDKESARFITSSHAASLRGRFSPNNYDRQQPHNLTSFGKQSLSVKQNVPAYGFGSQPRMAFKTSQTPGPGSYEN